MICIIPNHRLQLNVMMITLIYPIILRYMRIIIITFYQYRLSNHNHLFFLFIISQIIDPTNAIKYMDDNIRRINNNFIINSSILKLISYTSLISKLKFCRWSRYLIVFLIPIISRSINFSFIGILVNPINWMNFQNNGRI